MSSGFVRNITRTSERVQWESMVEAINLWYVSFLKETVLYIYRQFHWVNDRPAEDPSDLAEVKLNSLPIPIYITSNDRLFSGPIIYTETIHKASLFMDTSTLLDTTMLIVNWKSYLAIVASNKKYWRCETQFPHVAGSLLCGDIILQHLMTSFCNIWWHHFASICMTCTFWILNTQR